MASAVPFLWGAGLERLGRWLWWRIGVDFARQCPPVIPEVYPMVDIGAAGGGGIYFSESDRSAKDAWAKLQGARAAMLLYRATASA